MGIQFISFPMEVPEMWTRIVDLLDVPDDLELMALYRLGYLPDDERRPTIDWSSRERRRISQYVFRNSCRTPEPDTVTDSDPDSDPDPRPDTVTDSDPDSRPDSRPDTVTGERTVAT